MWHAYRHTLKPLEYHGVLALRGVLRDLSMVAGWWNHAGDAIAVHRFTLGGMQVLGTYDASVKLHPEVVGQFKVVVQKDTRA